MLMCDSEKMGLPLPPSNEWTQNMMMINSSMTATTTPTTTTTTTTTTSSSSSGSKVAMVMAHQDPLKCPRCDSSNTKFCYYNNYSLAQPRHFCKACKRYWTRGGTLRKVPVGGGCRKNKRVKKHQPAAAAPPPITATSNTTTATTSSAMVGTLQQTSQIRASSDLISSFFYGSDVNQLGSNNYSSFQPQFSALGFNSNILSDIQPSSAMTDFNPSAMANYENNLANNFGLVKGVKVEGGENTNNTVDSWQVMNPFEHAFSVDSNTNNNYLYWTSADPAASSSLAPLI